MSERPVGLPAYAGQMYDALIKLRNRYKSQAQFADADAAAYFRDFIRDLDKIINLSKE